jgi:hypothetical protein
MVAAVTATAGNLLLTGEITGDVLALDARSGDVRYRFATGNPIGGGIVTYAVGPNSSSPSPRATRRTSGRRQTGRGPRPSPSSGSGSPAPHADQDAVLNGIAYDVTRDRLRRPPRACAGRIGHRRTRPPARC